MLGYGGQFFLLYRLLSYIVKAFAVRIIQGDALKIFVTFLPFLVPVMLSGFRSPGQSQLSCLLCGCSFCPL